MKSLNVNFPLWVLDEIERRADEEETTMGDVVREMVERGIKRKS